MNQPVIWEMVGYDPWVNPGPMCKRRSVASRFLQERNGFLCQCPRCQAEACSPSEASGAPRRHPTEVAFEKKNGFGTGGTRFPRRHRMVPVKNLRNSKKVEFLEFWQKMSEIKHNGVFFSQGLFFHGLFNLNPPTYRPHEGFVTSFPAWKSMWFKM